MIALTGFGATALHDGADVVERRQPRREQHVGAGVGERLEPADRVLQIGDAVQKVLGARRQRERKRQRARGCDGRAHALDARGRTGRSAPRRCRLRPRSSRRRAPASAASADRCRTRLRVVGEAVLEIGADGQRRRVDDRPRVGERLVARDGAFAVGLAERERESGARRRQRLETQRGQHLRGPRVPRIGDREDRRPPVQRGKGFATDRLRAHPAILRRRIYDGRAPGLIGRVRNFASRAAPECPGSGGRATRGRRCENTPQFPRACCSRASRTRQMPARKATRTA